MVSEGNDAPLPKRAFLAAGDRRLRGAGLFGGHVEVTLADDALLLVGAASGTLRIEAAGTERIRLGYVETKHGRYHAARIWLMGRDAPLILEPTRRGCWDYGAVMRGFAERVAAARGIARVERGISGVGAACMIALLLLPTTAYTALAIALMERRDWVGWGAGLIFFWLLGGLFLMLYLKRWRPRPVTGIAELDTQLPGPNHRL